MIDFLTSIGASPLAVVLALGYLPLWHAWRSEARMQRQDMRELFESTSRSTEAVRQTLDAMAKAVRDNSHALQLLAKAVERLERERGR